MLASVSYFPLHPSRLEKNSTSFTSHFQGSRFGNRIVLSLGIHSTSALQSVFSAVSLGGRSLPWYPPASFFLFSLSGTYSVAVWWAGISLGSLVLRSCCNVACRTLLVTVGISPASRMRASLGVSFRQPVMMRAAALSFVLTNSTVDLAANYS